MAGGGSWGLQQALQAHTDMNAALMDRAIRTLDLWRKKHGWPRFISTWLMV